MSLRYSCLIVSWNVKHHLKRCLISLDRAKQSTEMEVIVVDNASTDGSVELLRQEFPWVKLITLSFNSGFGAANNLAARQAAGEYLVLLNPDTEITDTFFIAVDKFFLQHEQVAAVGGKILNEDGSLQPSVRGFPGLWSSILDSLKLLKRFPGWGANYLALGFNYNRSAIVDQVMGACMVIPKLVWDRLGGFDEGYWIWFEEADLCYRAKKHGLQVWYEPTMIIRHTQAASFKQMNFFDRHKTFSKSLLRFLKLHRGYFTLVLVWFISRVWFIPALILDYARKK